MSNGEPTKATFKIKGTDTLIPVHFNPDSLQYTITNTLRNQGRGNNRKQYVSESTGKLTMDLVFDTTHNGEDVRLHTVKIARFMEPRRDKTPPIVVFRWGLYKFQGMVESYKETIDFFAHDGVPLRASINLTLSSQDKLFEGGRAGTQTSTSDQLNTETQEISAYPRSGRGVTDVTTQGNNPSATRSVGQDNGIENLRFPEQDAVDLSGSPSLRPPPDFSSGAAGFEFGHGSSLDIGGGISGGISAAGGLSLDAGISAGASAGGGARIRVGVSAGGRASAGVSASAGAFAGLRTQAKVASVSTNLNIENFIEAEATANFGTEDDLAFGLGGQAGLSGSASFKADVGKAGELSAKIEFDGD